MTAMEKKAKDDANKYHAERRNLIARINKNDYFSNKKPQDPLDFINKATEKSAINPGIIYESTS